MSSNTHYANVTVMIMCPGNLTEEVTLQVPLDQMIVKAASKIAKAEGKIHTVRIDSLEGTFTRHQS